MNFHCEDADQAHAHLSRAYMEIDVRRFDPGASFSLDTDFTVLGETVFGNTDYAASAEMRTVSFDDPCFLVLHAGAYRAEQPGDECDAAIGGSILLTPYRLLDLTVDRPRFTSVTVARELIDGVAEATTGREGDRVEFGSGHALTPAREQQWVSTVAHVRRAILPHPELVANRLITGQAQRLLAAVALQTFPNTATAPGHPGSAGVETLRRAKEFIEDNAATDISLNDIARAARVDVPTLRVVFDRHLGMTPSAYLRRTRLDRVHHEIQPAGDRYEIARRWGFADRKRFEAEYRRAYGRRP